MAELDLLMPALLRQAALLSAGVVLLALLRPLLRRAGPRLTYAAWSLLPLLLLTPALPRPPQEPITRVIPAAGTWAAGVAQALPALPAPLLTAAGTGVALWLAGAAALLVLQAARQWRLARLGGSLPAGSSPALVGVLRPRVALPVDFGQRFSPAEQQLILAHEQVHRERLDNLWNLLACLLTALHWWNPLAWWSARRFRADQELACDATVLATRPGALADYTRALLAAHDLHSLVAPLASRWGTHHPLVERIAMLNRPRPLSRPGAIALASLLLGAAGLAYAAQASAPAADAPAIDLHLDVSYRTGDAQTRKTMSTRTTLRVKAGERATLMFNGKPDAPTPESLAIAIVARDLGDDKIELQAEVSKGNPLTVAYKPRLITRNGVKALIEQGDADPAAGDHLSLAITPTVRGTQPPAVAAPQPGTR